MEKGKKRLWIINHYATDTFFDRGGRHYCFAKYLIKSGYDVRIICASTVHNTDTNIDTNGKKHINDIVDGIPYTFIKTSRYSGNGIKRIYNMFQFFVRFFSVAREIIKVESTPDIILASSVHPLALVAGIKFARRLNIPCICEVRDLWPESLVTYGVIHKKSPMARMLRRGERWIYEKADALIFTMEGGKDYIVEQGWDKQSGGNIDLNKVYHINNGVDLEQFDYDAKNFDTKIDELDEDNIFKVVYTGSIRMVNQIELLIDTGKVLKQKGIADVIIYIFGDGTEKQRLEKRCIDENIDNIKFMGRVEKARIPSILKHSDLNIMVGQNSDIYRFGLSLNKMFEYLASGKPIVSTLNSVYDIITDNNCGVTVEIVNPKTIAETIECFRLMTDVNYARYCDNARKTASQYDFAALTKKLEKICIKALVDRT